MLSKEKSEDLTYFVEDDYIHEKISLTEMLYTYEKKYLPYKRRVNYLSNGLSLFVYSK